VRRHLLALSVALTGLAVPASAATPTRCPQLSDPVGDHDSVLGTAASDLAEVRVSGNGRSVTVELKLADLATSTPAPTGHVYDVYLDDGETGRVLSAAVDGLSPAFRAGLRPGAARQRRLPRRCPARPGRGRRRHGP
jgi:hypothetical protein